MLGRVLLIGNPAAQNGAAAQVIPAAAGKLRALEGCASVNVAYTQAPGHAKQLAHDAHDVDTIIVLGGDGAVHEACNGIMERGDVSLRSDVAKLQLGLIPFGSGNDYARTLGMPCNLDKAVGALARAQAQFVDTGLCNGEYFCETLSFGLDAAIALDTVQRRKRTGKTGTALYLASGIDQLLHHRDTHRIVVAFDGEEPLALAAHLLAVQIGHTYGGGFNICPKASVTDGIFDICYADAPMSLAQAGVTFALAKEGKHVNRPKIHFRRAQSLHIEVRQPISIQIDGEPLTQESFDISSVRQSLCVLRAPDMD